MSSSEAYVSFQGVQKSYDGETLVVKDLNLDTQRGAFRFRKDYLSDDVSWI